jgi:inner membrane protein
MRRDWRFWTIALVCSALPDVDVIGFSFGVRYGDLWGHRGMTHSILFAAIAGIVAAMFLGGSRGQLLWNGTLLFLTTASHGFLDAMTNGGLGIAFFSPFDQTRYFLPWRPILVSPIGLGRFLSERGAAVLGSEIVFVWMPAIVVGVSLYVLRRFRDSKWDAT